MPPLTPAQKRALADALRGAPVRPAGVDGRVVRKPAAGPVKLPAVVIGARG